MYYQDYNQIKNIKQSLFKACICNKTEVQTLFISSLLFVSNHRHYLYEQRARSRLILPKLPALLTKPWILFNEGPPHLFQEGLAYSSLPSHEVRVNIEVCKSLGGALLGTKDPRVGRSNTRHLELQ